MAKADTRSFYITGGTLRHDAPSYIERAADRELYEGLMRGEFCYVLTSRQMGKSSLMVHTAARLRQEGIAVVVLDFTAIGRNLTAEQWYDGLLGHVGYQLGLEDELDAFWLVHPRLGPLQRWMAALREVVLETGVRGQGSGVSHEPNPSDLTPDPRPLTPAKLVIFIDEIDAVRGLPFSTDEFLAAIRECYNRRSQDPAFERLTFCLLGVATPSDLIRDTRLTPFNIGRRIELSDFTEGEAAPLVPGLAQDERTGRSLLARVLFWTGGHPYLTQRLCRAVAEANTETNPKSKTQNPKSEVDRLCQELFLSSSAREKDDNLLFVRERLLRSEADLAALLDLYRQVLAGKRVFPDEGNPLISLLRLSGIVRLAEMDSLRSSGHPVIRSSAVLRVRNRIYERVFNQHWVTQNVPDAELRRQRAAYRRGLWRAAGVSTAVVLVMAGLVLTAMNQAQVARRQRQLAEQQRQRAEEGQRALRDHLYAARVSLAQQAADEGNLPRAQSLLGSLRPEPGQEDLRGFEWRYLWRRSQGDARFTFPGHNDAVDDVAFSPDGRILAVGVDDGQVKLWAGGAGGALWGPGPGASRQEIGMLRGNQGEVLSEAFSPDGSLLASGGADKTVRLWDVATRRELIRLNADPMEVWSLAFSPDGQILAAAHNGVLKLWAVHRSLPAAGGRSQFQPPRRALRRWPSPASTRPSAPVSRSAARDSGPTARVVCKEIATLKRPTGDSHSLAFSPNGKLLATGGMDGTVHLWEVPGSGPSPTFGGGGTTAWSGAGPRAASSTPPAWREIAALKGHTRATQCLAFSRDGKLLASGSDDYTARLWDVAARREIATFSSHTDVVLAVAFSPDARTLATGSVDNTIKLWDLPSRHELATLRGHTYQVNAVAFSPDGKILASGSLDRMVKLWDPTLGGQTPAVLRQPAAVQTLAFSSDGRLLATGNADGTARLWDVARRREIAKLHGHKLAVGSMAFSPDGKLLATGSDDHTVKLWDVAARREREIIPRFRGGLYGLAFAPDGRTLALQGRDAVMLWDVAARQAVTRFPCDRQGPLGLTFSPDGTILAALTASGTAGYTASGTVTLWNTVTHQAARTFNGLLPLAFSPDGSILALNSALNSSDVDLRETTTGRRLAFLPRERPGGAGFAFSPDGKTLADAQQNTVVLWNLLVQQEAAVLKGHIGAVTAVAFSPDGNTLAVGGSDGTIRLWQAAPLEETDPLRVAAAAGDRTVLLQWRPVPSAVGYNVYRASGVHALRRSGVQREPTSGAERRNTRTPEHLYTWINLTPQPVSRPFFIDRGGALVNGRPELYGVRAVYQGVRRRGKGGGWRREGPLVAVPATPAPVPHGFLTCSIDEAPRHGSVRFDEATGGITLRGAGTDILGTADQFYFLCQPATGDFQVTVEVNTRPTGPHQYAHAGLMIRESLDPGARHAMLLVTAEHDPQIKWRRATDGMTDLEAVLSGARLTLPVLFRLTRRGSTVSAEWAPTRGAPTGAGQRFQPLGDPIVFDPPLAETVLVGLAATSHESDRISETRFSGLEITPLVIHGTER